MDILRRNVLHVLMENAPGVWGLDDVLHVLDMGAGELQGIFTLVQDVWAQEHVDYVVDLEFVAIVEDTI